MPQHARFPRSAVGIGQPTWAYNRDGVVVGSLTVDAVSFPPAPRSEPFENVEAEFERLCLAEVTLSAMPDAPLPLETFYWKLRSSDSGHYTTFDTIPPPGTHPAPGKSEIIPAGESRRYSLVAVVPRPLAVESLRWGLTGGRDSVVLLLNTPGDVPLPGCAGSAIGLDTPVELTNDWGEPSARCEVRNLAWRDLRFPTQLTPDPGMRTLLASVRITGLNESGTIVLFRSVDIIDDQSRSHRPIDFDVTINDVPENWVTLAKGESVDLDIPLPIPVDRTVSELEFDLGRDGIGYLLLTDIDIPVSQLPPNELGPEHDPAVLPADLTALAWGYDRAAVQFGKGQEPRATIAVGKPVRGGVPTIPFYSENWIDRELITFPVRIENLSGQRSEFGSASLIVRDGRREWLRLMPDHERVEGTALEGSSHAIPKRSTLELAVTFGIEVGAEPVAITHSGPGHDDRSSVVVLSSDKPSAIAHGTGVPVTLHNVDSVFDVVVHRFPVGGSPELTFAITNTGRYPLPVGDVWFWLFDRYGERIPLHMDLPDELEAGANVVVTATVEGEARRDPGWLMIRLETRVGFAMGGLIESWGMIAVEGGDA